MVTLDEYLGGIFASLTRARMMADAQVVATAKIYAQDDLLRQFTVPHLRFSEIEITIPLAIESMTGFVRSAISETERDALRDGIIRDLAKPLGVRRFSQAATSLLSAKIDVAIDRLAEKGDARLLEQSLAEFAQSLADEIGGMLKSIGANPSRFDGEVVTATVRGVANAEVTSAAPVAAPGGIQVIAESHLLREQRPSDMVVIKMSVSEEGMGWQNMEMSDGRIERKLLPE